MVVIDVGVVVIVVGRGCHVIVIDVSVVIIELGRCNRCKYGGYKSKRVRYRRQYVLYR